MRSLNRRGVRFIYASVCLVWGNNKSNKIKRFIKARSITMASNLKAKTKITKIKYNKNHDLSKRKHERQKEKYNK